MTSQAESSPPRRHRRGDTKAVLLNREQSWLQFNHRVLEEALDESNPLLERLRFLTIFHTNLDEFFMIRVAGLKHQLEADVDVLSPDGLTPRAQLLRLGETIRPMLEVAQKSLNDDLLPALDENEVHLVRYQKLSQAERRKWDAWYERNVHPVLTPLAVGPHHPFPFISNQSLNLALVVRSPDGEQRFARVKVPGMLPRLVALDDDPDPTDPIHFMPIEDLIAANLHTLFPGVEVGSPWLFRVTRDTDIEIAEDEAEDLLKSVEEEVRKRRFGEAVRLEVQRGIPTSVRDAIRKGLGLRPQDIYEVDGLLDVPRLSQILQLDRPDLKYPPFTPKPSPLSSGSAMFREIRAGDVLLHHPFDSFAPVTEFLWAAARDPQVAAIKMTLYRTSGDSQIIQALETAIDNGKQVAAVVELKARFDEENNITWAKRLEQAGVHVVYGVPGLKVHSKLLLVVRSEGDGLRRYAHVGTGNYNPNTSRVYTDLGLFTANPSITHEVADVFNQLTGFAVAPRSKGLLVAPRHMARMFVEKLHREVEAAKAGRVGHVIFKCNAITDPEIIRELYAASRAGVKIDLIVRGICCLLPGKDPISEHIQVRSVVGRFLEHSRVFWFHHDGNPEVLIGSADLMDRNLRRRVEVMVPIEDPELKAWLREVLLERYLRDTARTRQMQPDGSYRRTRDIAGTEHDVHQEFVRDRRRASS
jgi:polyphosphate kinase